MENTDKNVHEKSYLLMMLENLERMVVCVRQCVNIYARDALLKSFATEAETVALKMMVMSKRWEVFLPFKEAWDVDLIMWERKVMDWMTLFTEGRDMHNLYPRLEAEERFFLDLYNLQVGRDVSNHPIVPIPDYLNIKSLISERRLIGYHILLLIGTVNDLVKTMTGKGDYLTEISRNCLKILKDKLELMVNCDSDPTITNQIDTLVSIDVFQQKLCKESIHLVLMDLQHAIDCLKSVNFGQAFADRCARSTYRIIGNYCQNLYDNVKTKVETKMNLWPSSDVPSLAQKEKEILQEQLRAHRWGEELMTYVDFNNPHLEGDENFGRFLFKNRAALEIKDVQELYLICEEIELLNKHIQPLKKDEEIANQPAQPRKLNKVEQQILDQLMDLAEKGDWTQGATVESIQAGLKRALGVGDPLPEELQAQSEQLWTLFKKRGGCDAEKSLRVTWLNIAGWCVKKGILKGGSDNDICKRFFPNCGDKDYMNVSRGRNDSVKTFVEIHKLLETCLLPKQS